MRVKGGGLAVEGRMGLAVADKMRVHILAKELNVSSKTIIEKCRAEGIDGVKNHMSTLSAGLHATIREWFSEGSHDTAVETSERINLEKVRLRPKRRTKTTESAADETEFDEAESTEEALGDSPEYIGLEPDQGILTPLETQRPVSVEEQAHVQPMAEPEPVEVVEIPVTSVPVAAPPAEQPPISEAPPIPAATTSVSSPAILQKSVTPAGPQNVPAPAKLQGPRVVRYEAPERDVGPIRRVPPGRRPGDTGSRLDPGLGAGPPPPAGDDAKKGASTVDSRRKGRANPRRTVGRVAEAGERLSEWRDADLAERRERLASATGRRIHTRRSTPVGPTARNQVPAGPKTRAMVHEPVRIKEFCAATGVNFIQVFKVLRDEHGLMVNINMTVPTDTAQLLALHFGMDLEVVPARTLLDQLEEDFSVMPRGELKSRPPVVTMLGHVDHGKTSLLDAIRRAKVAAGEDGGITQHIGSYSVETSRGPVTFLDTPGHEAFTAMRARGAQLTDVVVLVVAADDGVMPQTVEAINHAKAAKVPIVVALNKIDLGDQNKLKVYGQLSEHGLAPSEWGGDVDVIGTSATTGVGVNELVEHLADLSGLLDLKADPDLPARGTVIEAETKSGVGAVVRVLVQEGTLNVGDFVVCGSSFGKVRAILDSRGNRLQQAGPSIPAEVWGLDDVPMAGDKLFQVDKLERAKDVAAEVKRRRVESGRMQIAKAKTLEDMFRQRDKGEVPELNLVIKGDVDGSVSALKHALEEIPSDEVRLSVRHAGVGAVTDSDILLAATSGGIVVAFRVDTSVGARRLADQHGVDVRTYRVIYDVCDDIKKALEGLLAPEEKIEQRGQVEVRQVFHITKVGVVAGSLVTQGPIDRSQWVKVIRDGVVIREGCKFSSLRRFKDDVREVRAGMECGIRLEGFDDLHAGDVLSTYEIVKIARTL